MDHSRRNLIKYIGLSGGAAIAGAIPGCAASNARSRPAMNTESGKFERMRHVLSGYVERGEIPGLVALVSLGGKPYVETLGTQAIGGASMRQDTIFRISSMTKPVSAVAAMILVEQGKLQLDGPVERWLPELANRRVLSRIDAPLDDTVPAKRSITVRDLLTFCLGFGLVMAPPDSLPIQKAVSELKLMTLGPPIPACPLTPDEWIRQFATLPLMHQPGEQWMYNTSAHVLGVLISRASGQSLETFLRERLFEPIGMKDTAFSVPADKLGRLATSYRVNPQTHALELWDDVRGSQWSHPPPFPDAAAGLVSTADDFFAFGQMLLNKGTFGRERILTAASVQSMTTDQLTADQRQASAFVPGFWDHRGWGYGMAVIKSHERVPGLPNGFGWDGGLGTSWYSDPQTDRVTVLMTQQAWTSPNPPPVCRDFWSLAFQT